MAIDVKITDNSKKFLDALPIGIERALIAIGATAESYAKEYIRDAPAVVTGRLMNSISYAVALNEEAVYIGTNVEYAQGIETGTHRKAGGVHFLQRAASDHNAEYRDLADKAIESVKV